MFHVDPELIAESLRQMLDSQGYALYAARLRKMLDTDTARLVDASTPEEMRLLQGRIRATREALEIPHRMIQEQQQVNSGRLAD